MTPDDVVAAMVYLDLDVEQLAMITGETPRRCAAWAHGAETAPVWLDHLLYCWGEHPDTLAMARQDAASRVPLATDGDAPMAAVA